MRPALLKPYLICHLLITIILFKKHPDKSDSSSCCEEFHRIDSAIKVLSNDSSRRQYDSQLIGN